MKEVFLFLLILFIKGIKMNKVVKKSKQGGSKKEEAGKVSWKMDVVTFKANACLVNSDG